MRYLIAVLLLGNAWLFYGLDFRFWSVAVALAATLITMHVTGWSADE